MLKRTQTLVDRIDQKVFDALTSRSLVYNTCWEDPAVDRRALALKPEDRVLVITSAGCNALDYALAGPARVYAVDANPRQSALLELKLAAIRRLEFEDFFLIFGEGRHQQFDWLYRDVLRRELSPFAQGWWDRHGHWFFEADPRDSFYFHGLAGMVARGFRGYLNMRPALRQGVQSLLEAQSLPEQQEIYDRQVHPLMWTPGMNWTLSRQITMSFLGVPHPQRKEVQRQHENGVAGFVREAIEYVFRHLPVWNNYFWSLYLRGRYTPECCPEYLKPANFAALKGGLVDGVEVHTSTVTEFLHGTRERISKYVLLDHMDWMSSYHPDALVEEWQAILERASAQARIIFRSAHLQPSYIDELRLEGGKRLRDTLDFRDGLARALQPLDRVHTYAGFHIADVRA
jgi:S-adenosylmethionine-diacylglycerol 3-amino-3-carboxypropyl transferase